MAPAAALLDLWGADESDPHIDVDCLLPTGVLVPLRVLKDNSLIEIKEKLWEEARNYPLHQKLEDITSYTFLCINQMAEREELLDEGRTLCEVRPFQPFLKVIEIKGNSKEKMLRSQIGLLIGKSLREFDGMHNSEVNEFRSSMRRMCEAIAKERCSKNWLDQLRYRFPPDLDSSPELPKHVSEKLRGGKFLVKITYEASGGANAFNTMSLQVAASAKPSNLLDTVLRKKRVTNSDQVTESKELYILKICGREEYLIGEEPLGQYKYIRSMIGNVRYPQLILIPKKNVAKSENGPPELPVRPNKDRTKITPQKQERTSVSVYDVTDKYCLTIERVKNVQCPPNVKLCMRVGIFHGATEICNIIDTRAAIEGPDGSAIFDQKLTFDLMVQDLPRMARLCFTLYMVYDRNVAKMGTVTKRVKQGKMEVVPLAWLNITVFDYRDRLRVDQHTRHMWAYKEDSYQEDILNSIGTVESNPHTHEVALTFKFHNFRHGVPILYPPFATVLECAAQNTKKGNDNMPSPHIMMGNPDNLEQLRSMIEQDPLAQRDMHVNEKVMVWNLREECRENFSHSLAILLSCVNWNNHIEVAMMQALLQIWPPLPPELALKLLDFGYADKAVRKFAVKCLKDMSDDMLCQYLLQLVQTLKYESYLNCDLVEFLLRRALTNQKIGHYLFWLIRSEMHVASVSVRFGLILEAYCWGSREHMCGLSRELEALNKLNSVNQLVKQEQYTQDKEKGIQDMRSILSNRQIKESLNNLQSPLNPSMILKKLKVEECSFKDSKMRPLWLVWENQDNWGEDIYVIFKNGDDLRQDMLTLQMLRIMDHIWKEEDLDLRLIPYGVVSTSNNAGMIEVVMHSQTIANIQKSYTSGLRSVFKKQLVYTWLKEHNPDGISLRKAVEDFTMSCAGYCVATYVLGIGDRHSDNIMVKKTGQLFHIDFGHILGNFKSKFGVKRERVPFVLVNEFVSVITSGDTSPQEFERFTHICERAFLVLRHKTNLLITLFMMMLSTGIPELSSVDDIRYLQQTLQPDLSEEEALKHFQAKFKDALKSNWTTSVNWWAHNVSRDNR